MNRSAIIFVLLLATILFPLLARTVVDREEQKQHSVPDGMLLVPAGPFTLGTDQEDEEGRGEEYGLMVPWFASAQPAHKVNIAAFYMDITEVTNDAYARFMAATGHRPPVHWGGTRRPPEGLENHPVAHVSWHDAVAFCAWAFDRRLPTEAEWEKAARGTDARNYPWGNDWDAEAANVASGHTSPVGSHPKGAGPYGHQDLVGNLWEWTASWYQAYSGGTYDDPKYGETHRTLRGNSWASIGHYPDKFVFEEIVSNNSRATYRLFLAPAGRLNDVGFRCVQDAG